MNRWNVCRETSRPTRSLCKPFLELGSSGNVCPIVQQLSHYHIMHALARVGTAVRDDRHYIFRVGGRDRSPQNTSGRAQPSEDQRGDALLLQEVVQAGRFERRHMTRRSGECDVVTATLEQLSRLFGVARFHGGHDAYEPAGVLAGRVRRRIDVNPAMDHLDALRFCPSPHFGRDFDGRKSP